MSNYSTLDINAVIELSKQLFENSRCVLCENFIDTQKIYPCGYTACNKCIDLSNSCMFSTSPPGDLCQHPVNDLVLTKRVRNARNLLIACQDTFNIDVYKRQRLSDQQKIEKEVFPQCIQAPLKYFNKKKSCHRTTKSKENYLPLFPGENTSLRNLKMENSFDYVQQWLHQNEKVLKRKPLSNINGNDLRAFHRSKNTKNHNAVTHFVGPMKSRKKHKKTPNISKNNNLIDIKKNDESIKRSKQQKRKLTQYKRKLSKSNNDNDESGIVIDDEIIEIGDSQSHNDKDVMALLAVMEANENSPSKILSNTKLDQSKNNANLCGDYYVPFYKRSKLIETCQLCNKEKSLESNTVANNISITIENNSFTTTINIDTNQHLIESKNTKSTLVQTDLSDVCIINELSNNSQTAAKQINTMESSSRQNFGRENQTSTKRLLELYKNQTSKRSERCQVVIEETDSDSDLECKTLEVVADIHKVNEDLDGVLTEIQDFEDHCNRMRRGPRGFTPNSSDSSEKENFNPNREKRGQIYKKKCKK